MKTVVLRGAKAAGRVALVDDEDYDLVAPYSWRIYERDMGPLMRAVGPYATTTYWDKGSKRYCDVRMHKLITGYGRTDHIDHDGLNNQRSNLRPATVSQNNQNSRVRLWSSSQYKGVFRLKRGRLWRASITIDGTTRGLGNFASEIQAAYAYDAAARDLFGEFACPNFADGPTQAMRDEWRVTSEARRAEAVAGGLRRLSVASADQWSRREPRTQVCAACGKEYQYVSIPESTYCSSACQQRARRRRISEERGLFTPKPCAFCGNMYEPRGGPSIYCSDKCNTMACEVRRRRRRIQQQGEKALP